MTALRSLLVLAASVIALVGTAPAFAHGGGGGGGCSAGLEATPAVTATLNAPLFGARGVGFFILRLDGPSDPSCRYSVRFHTTEPDPRLLREGGGGALEYVIARDPAGSTIVFDPLRASAHGRGRPDRARLINGEARLALLAAPGAAPRAGRHVSHVTATLHARDAEEALDEIEITLEAVVPARVRGYLSGAPLIGPHGAYALLNLGELEEGAEGRVGLHIDSTADIDVTLSSENDGWMAHQAMSGYGVPYVLSVDGEVADLDATTPVARSLDSDSSRLDLPVAIRVGSTENSPAGSYRDRITITVSAR